MRHIDKIIIHCSATPNGRPTTVKEIDLWHKKRGWSGIGYHYVIGVTGGIETGRPIEKTGAHCKGHNTGSIGVCMIGTDKYSLFQWMSFFGLMDAIKADYPTVTLHGHNEFSNKTCPGFDVKKIIEHVL